ncbi:EAL domain-containing protein [Gymnodinialimonas hymeniacidonis]|uniref:EAL domain-containing protein n=1 Tax=Gymnodinialimonas hymeniacidonis TaxID=3126508 RepID=UPI0034C62828
MSDTGPRATQQIGLLAQSALGRIEVLALFPLLVLTAEFLGFQNIALVTALGLSVLLAVAVLLPRRERSTAIKSVRTHGKAPLIEALAEIAQFDDRDTVCLHLEIDDWPKIVDMWGHDSSQFISQRLEDRFRSVLRSDDLLCQLGDNRFGIVLGGMSAARLSIRDTVATRLLNAASEPLLLHDATLRLTVTIGHASLRRRASDVPTATFKAAEAALSAAKLHGPGSVRAYTTGMGRAKSAASDLASEVEEAIHSGAIDVWFQPQVCAQTGELSGMETLARWQHPQHGLLGPSEIMSALQSAGHMALLGQTLTHRAIKVLAELDAAKARVPTMSINVSADELRDLTLPDALASELERYGLRPDRLTVEISPDITTQDLDDAILSNLKTLKDNGHKLDLEGIGTGAIPLSILQRFSVDRVKIDRALVAGSDADPERDRILRAIVSLSDAMGVQTVATGVETSHEATYLAGIGCSHLQGFGIARPMKPSQISPWVNARAAAGKTIDLEARRAG